MDDATQDPVDFWERRYGERDRIWSGRPNQALVGVVAGLPPGRALDLGCGEGGDSIWLTQQGWQVSAVDVSETAIERGQAAAAQRGLTIDWEVADLALWQPRAAYDLVSACFLHSPIEFPRTDVLRRAAQAVRPGGRLFILGHAEPPPWSRHRHHEGPQGLLGPDEEIAELCLDGEWTTEIAELRDREATGPDGQVATLHDSVVLLRRG